MLGEINRRTRINFLPIPYISKVWISWNFHPFHLFTSRHDIHGSLVLLSFWSHSIRLQSVPPSPSPTSENFLSVTEKGDSIGSHRHPRLLPSDPLCSTICLQCVRSSSFSRVSLSFPLNFSSFFSFEARTQLLENRRSTPPLFPFSL